MRRVANKCIQSNYTVPEGNQISTQNGFSMMPSRYKDRSVDITKELSLLQKKLRSHAHEFACASGFREQHKKITNENNCAVTPVRKMFSSKVVQHAVVDEPQS